MTAYGLPVPVRTPQRTVVDPEAHLLMSCCLSPLERRLEKLLAGLASTGSRLISIQRISKLRSLFPDHCSDLLSKFAARACDAGDRRWKGLAGDAEALQGGPKGEWPLRLPGGPALLLRLRAGMGVGAKADILCYLLASGRAAGVSETAAATGYSTVAVRSSLEEMVLSGLVRRRGGPALYSIDRSRWMELLDLGDRSAGQGMPGWVDWPGLFAFASGAIELSSHHSAGTRDDYLYSSDARGLCLAHSEMFSINGIPVPAFDTGAGTAFLNAYGSVLDAVSSWLEEAT